MEGSEKPWPRMNARQREIVAFMRKVGRVSSKRIGDEFNMTTDATTKALKRLEERGIVAKKLDGTWFA